MRRNPLQYPLSSELWWRKNMCEPNGYKPMTTFFADLSIAECFGAKDVEDTYKKVLKSWKHDIKYITEFVLCLNHKIWQLVDIDKPMAELYDKLWKKAVMFVEQNYKGEDLNYFYITTD